MAEAEDGVAVVHARVVEVDVGRAVGARAGRDDDVLGVELLDHAVRAHHFHGLLVGKAAGAEEHVDAVTGIVAGARCHLLGDDLLGAFQHVREREPARLADGTKHRVGVELHDLPHRVTQCLGRNGTQVGAVATDLATVIDHRYLAPCFGGIHCRAFTGRAGTQHHYVVVVDSHAYSFRTGPQATVARGARSCRRGAMRKFGCSLINPERRAH